MNIELKKKTEEWVQLERKTDKQRKIAESFYDDNLMSLIEEDFVERNEDGLEFSDSGNAGFKRFL